LLIGNKIFKYFCILKKKVFSLFFFDIYGLSKFFLFTKNKRICLWNYLFIYFIIIYSLICIVDLFINIIYIHLYKLFILNNNYKKKLIWKYFCLLWIKYSNIFAFERKKFFRYFFWHIWLKYALFYSIK